MKMPTRSDEAGDPASRKGAQAFGKDSYMKNTVSDDLLNAIARLSEGERKKVAEFVFRLNNHGERNPRDGISDNEPWKPKPFKNYKWIVQDQELVGGHLAIRGTRLPVSLILECLAASFDLNEIVSQYPTFPKEALPEVFQVAAELTDAT